MEQNQLVALLNRLRKEPTETEWLEFKANRYDGQQLENAFMLVYNKDE
jgi:hypothetical protein